jgi:hypothetical protein
MERDEICEPIHAFMVLGITRIAPEERDANKARDQAVVALARDIAALRELAQKPPVTLEVLYRKNLLPKRIFNYIRGRKEFRMGLDPMFTKDLALFDECDFRSFSRSLRGPITAQILQSLCDVFLETDHFRKLPNIDSCSESDIGPEEQEALLKRIGEAVRGDPTTRKLLFRLFCP